MAKNKGFNVGADGTINVTDTTAFTDNLQAVAEKMSAESSAGASAVQIKKAVIKNNLFLQVEYSEKQKDGTNAVKKDCTAPVHDDLKLAFKKLIPHLALICAQVNTSVSKAGITVQAAFAEEEVKWQLDPDHDFSFNQAAWETVAKHFITGFTVGGSDDGVTLMGWRELKDDKVLNLTSPYTKWEDDYEFASELGAIIEECKSEVKKYLFEGKHQPDAQLDLFADGEEEDPLLK